VGGEEGGVFGGETLVEGWGEFGAFLGGLFLFILLLLLLLLLLLYNVIIVVVVFIIICDWFRYRFHYRDV